MKNRIFLAMLLVTSGLLASCWNTKKKSDVAEGAKDSSLVTTEQVTTSNTQKLSSVVSDALLFDGPISARYILSSAKELSENKIVKFDFNKDGKEEIILLGRDHPNGVRVLAERNDITQNLINDITEGYFFDSYGELKSDYSIQVTIVDLDNDGRCEVMVTIGKLGERVDGFIFIIKDTDKGSFNYVGSIKGKSCIELTSNQKIKLTDLDDKEITYELYNKELALVK